MKFLFLILFTIFSTQTYGAAESWYFNFGLGAPFDIQYSQDIDDRITAFEDAYDNFNIDKSAMEFGFYWKGSSESSIYGLTYSSSGEIRFTDEGDELVLAMGILGVSTMYFSGSEPGSGLFLRLDAGRAGVAVEQNITTGSLKKESTGWGGFGGAAAIGFGIPVSEETRYLFGCSYSYVEASGRTIKWATAYVDFLF